ncbi:G1/S-specific cyclin-D2 [Eurytemora carolleeae]|uniref:G1/S-specific cyclin-D2 n=1 Tax=Eurytemora carolleeae TaxID=1294199 RepID=UPI000C757905|nr:G1/S-specific cyclin-D2 [Eurytemora carolleeae]|eukprot:XP_023334158.1 G1/S-specific cyclin-D2-like [Eurytemora affinis]
MEDLRCTETFGETVSPARNLGGYITPLVCRAYRDPVILEDTRVFQNMLDIEEFYVAASNYFQNTQTEIKPHMRKIVTDWMLEVCLDQNCHADVFLLSCNVMDRFLSQINIRKNQFQLVAAATIFISSKLVDPCPITGCDLIKYTDNTYQLTELLEMELLILSKLKWDLSAVTPYDFLDYLLRLLSHGNSALSNTSSGWGADSSALRRHTENFIILCATEFRFSMYPPSMLSSAALAAAAHSLDAGDGEINGGGLDLGLLVKKLQVYTRVENDCLQTCIQQIEDTFKTASENVNNKIKTQKHIPANSSPSKVNNNTKQSKLEPTKELDNVTDRKSQTPTEVFSADWLFVA